MTGEGAIHSTRGGNRGARRRIHIGMCDMAREIRAAEFTTGNSDVARVARRDPTRTGDRRRHRRPRGRSDHPAPQERQAVGV